MYITPRGVKVRANGTVTVHFDQQGMEQVEEAADVRQNGMRGSGVPTQRVSRVHSDRELDVLGIMAELAWAAYLDLRVRVESDVDPGHDLTVATGQTVDVKGSFKDDAPLRFRKACRADIAAHCVKVDDSTIRLTGWTDKPRVGQQSQKTLRPPEELLARHETSRDA